MCWSDSLSCLLPGYTEPLIQYEGSLTLTGSSCTDGDKSSLESALKRMFVTIGLCASDICQSDKVDFKINCYFSGKTKRSTEPVQFTVDFSIKNDEYVDS